MKFNIITLLVSITGLSLLDTIFDVNSIPKSSLFTYLWMFFVLAFLFSFWRLLVDFSFESAYFKYAFIAFFLYGLITVLRGWSFTPADLTSFLRVPYIFWPFLMPLFIFIDKKLSTIAFFMECFYYLGLFFLFVAICFPGLLLSRPTAEPIIFALALGCELLLLNITYVSKKKGIVAFTIFVLSTLSMVYLARRANTVMFVGVIISSYIIGFSSKLKPFIFKLLPFLVLGVGIAFFIASDISNTLTSKLGERLNEDSRTDVIDYFMADMKNSMIFGKGMNGKYYCPVGGGGVKDDGMEWEAVDYRDTIENGYLHLILAGGIIHLLLFLLITLPAAFNGLFRSSNIFTRSFGIIILLWLIYMFAYGQPNLSVGYMLVWISVAICYKPSLRNKTDLEIMLGLNNPKIQIIYDSKHE